MGRAPGGAAGIRRPGDAGGGLGGLRGLFRHPFGLLWHRSILGGRWDNSEFWRLGWVGWAFRLRCAPLQNSGSYPIKERLRGLGRKLSLFTEHLDVTVFALVLPGEIRVTRDLL